MGNGRLGRTRGVVYLFHFSRPYAHAQHYLGWTTDLPRRLAEHREGGKTASPLITAALESGIDMWVSRIWRGVTRATERDLKRRKNGSSICPHCKAERNERSKLAMRRYRARKLIARNAA